MRDKNYGYKFDCFLQILFSWKASLNYFIRFRNFLKMKSLCIFIVILFSLTEVLCDCNTCLTTGLVACFSQTQYFSCSGTTIDLSALKTCPTGQFCGDIAGSCSLTATPACEVTARTVTPGPTPTFSCSLGGKVTKFVKDFLTIKIY